MQLLASLSTRSVPGEIAQRYSAMVVIVCILLMLVWLMYRQRRRVARTLRAAMPRLFCRNQPQPRPDQDILRAGLNREIAALQQKLGRFESDLADAAPHQVRSPEFADSAFSDYRTSLQQLERRLQEPAD